MPSFTVSRMIWILSEPSIILHLQSSSSPTSSLRYHQILSCVDWSPTSGVSLVIIKTATPFWPPCSNSAIMYVLLWPCDDSAGTSAWVRWLDYYTFLPWTHGIRSLPWVWVMKSDGARFNSSANSYLTPGFYLISMWYKRTEAQKRFALFFVSTQLAGAFGGLLATAIGKMNGIKGYHA